MHKAWALGLGLLMALSGCLSSGADEKENNGGETVVAPLVPDVNPMEPDHDHADPSLHKFLWNYNFTHRDALMQNPANVAGLHALQMADGHLFGATYGSHAAAVDGGLSIWDLANPAEPELVGQVIIPGAVGGDRSLGVTPDGNFAVLGAETVTCFGQVSPASAAVTAYLIDTSDKSNPTIVDTISGPYETSTGDVLGGGTGAGTVRAQPGEHSVTMLHSNGTDYVYLSGTQYMIDPEGTGGGKLLSTGANVNVGHDMYVRTSPSGTAYGLVGGGTNGVTIYDLTDPVNPVQVAHWEDPDRPPVRSGSDIVYYYHTVDMAFFADQDLMVLTSEDVGGHVSPMWILDGTPLRDGPSESIELELLGMWQNPWDTPAQSITFSMHNPRFTHDGIFTLSHYHGGVMQLDFSEPEWRANPALIAYATFADDDAPLMTDPQQSTVSSQLCGIEGTLATPSVMDIEVAEDGTIYAADIYMGLYTFVPTEDHPVFGA